MAETGFQFSASIPRAKHDEPLLVAVPGVSWEHRLQEPHELMAYCSLLDANTGTNQ